MVMISALFASAVMLGLSAIHLYWALGGKRGLAAAIPEYKGKPLFAAPGPAAAFAVGFVLFAGALVLPARAGVFGESQNPLFVVGSWVLAAVFLVRAIGDFTFIGFFKRVRGTLFARWDTFLYSPISLVLVGCCAFTAYSPS